MKTLTFPVTLLSFLLFLISCNSPSAEKGSLKVEHSTCEYLEKPLGIETQTPRFSWKLSSEMQGDRQTAYQVILADSEEAIKKGNGTIWDTQRVQSDQSLNVVYQGETLKETTRYWWAVKVWDADGHEQDWSEAEWFETGIFGEEGWKGAKWIGLAEDHRSKEYSSRPLQIRTMDAPRLETSHASPVLRKEFSLDRKMKQARIYLAGLGYNELYVNGERVDDAVLNPGQTSYDKRAFYDVYDISGLVKDGPNVLGVMLGNGFYGQSMAFGVKFLNYGVPALKCIALIEYDDGTVEELVSNESWLSHTGPVVFDNVYAGETYDAREEIVAWNRVDCNFDSWQKAKVLKDVDVPILTAQLLQPNTNPYRSGFL